MQKKSTGLIWLLQLFSKIPLAVLQSIASLLAHFILFVAQAKTLKVIQLNLEIAFPNLEDTQRKQLAKRAAINEVTSYFEFFHIWGSEQQKNIQRIHQVHGEDLFQHALHDQKGLVLIIPHFGTWEVMNAWLSQFTTLTIMYKPIKNLDLDQFVREARSREHADLVPTNDTGVKQVFKALKQGGVTAILPDHRPRIGGDLIDWFAVPVYSSQLSAKLVQKTKATALLLYAIRNDNAGFELHIEPISEHIYTAENGTALIHHTLQDLIQRYPEHYHWSYKRFNANPETHPIYDIPHDEAIMIIRNIQSQQSSR